MWKAAIIWYKTGSTVIHKCWQETESPTPSSTASESQPHTPAAVSGGLDAFSWPAHTHYEENRLLLATEEESSERQSSDEDDALAVSGDAHYEGTLNTVGVRHCRGARH